MSPDNETKGGDERTATAVFLTFLRLGLTSFGGPVAHIGYSHNAPVVGLLLSNSL